MCPSCGHPKRAVQKIGLGARLGKLAGEVGSWAFIIVMMIALYPIISGGGVLDQLYPNWMLLVIAALGLWLLAVAFWEWWERRARRRRRNL